VSKKHLQDGIENQANKQLRISDDLAEILEYLCSNGVTEPNDDAEKTGTITSACSEATYQRLERLHELGFVKKFKKGPKTYVIHTRKDDIVNGEPLLPLVEEEIRRLIQHLQKDPVVKLVVANELGVKPSDVVTELRSGGFNEKQANLERSVEAIQEDAHVSQGDYGAVIFRHASNWYTATAHAVGLFEK